MPKSSKGELALREFRLPPNVEITLLGTDVQLNYVPKREKLKFIQNNTILSIETEG